MSTPQYQIIRAELEARIHSGELTAGDRLPTEAEIQAEHSVSRSVAQRVLNDLAHAGLVVRRKRLGTHVAQGAQQMNLMRSLDPRIEEAGLPGRMELISAVVLPAGKADVSFADLDDDVPVTQLIRVRHDLKDDAPTAVEVAAVPFGLAPGLLEEDLEAVSIRAYFASNRISIARSRMYFDPILLEQKIADLLGIESGAPVLRRRRHMWQPNGQIAESAAYYLRPDAMEFYIEYSDQSSTDPRAVSRRPKP